MIEFWSIVAIAWLLLLIVLLFPLLRRQASSSQKLKSLKSRLLVSALLATFIVASSALLYIYSSNGYSLIIASAEQDRDMIELTEQLATRLAQSPQDNPDGWLLLASSYAVLGQYDKAVDAYAQAERYTQLEAWAQIGYAEALLIAEGALNSKAMTLLDTALANNPDNPQGLFLIGLAHIEQRNYAQTIAYWEHLLTVLAKDDPLASAVAERLVEVKGLGAEEATNNEPSQPIMSEAEQQPPSAKMKSPDEDCFIHIQVELAAELATRITATDTLFVYAKAVQGPPMPLAIKQFQASALPLETCLAAEDAMIEGMTINSADTIQIIARVSKSGIATPQPGDLQAISEAIASQSGSAVSLLIDKIVE